MNGLPPFWEQIPNGQDPGLEATMETAENNRPNSPKTKQQVCHTFHALNKATQVPPFPAGNLCSKQEFAAGHRWASVINFAAGYYAVPLDDESVPYVAFYVEGRGYYVYLWMPFSLTGAPTTFCEMVAIAVTIFLLFTYTSSSCRTVASLHSHFITLINSAVCFTTMISLSHVHHSYFDACISYMLPTCLFFTYLLHAMQAWLVCI